MTELTLKKLQALLEDESIELRLSEAGSTENVVSILREYDVDITEDDVNILIKNGSEDELDEGYLDQVAGGIIMPVKWRKVWAVVKKKCIEYLHTVK